MVGFSSASFITAAIEVDDSELDEEDREFLKEWTNKLNETLPSSSMFSVSQSGITLHQYLRRQKTVETVFN